jgi:1-acyl-sn-glycerol-3-phosphate acyltransferase
MGAARGLSDESSSFTIDRIDCRAKALWNAEEMRGWPVNFLRAVGRSIRLAGMFVWAGAELAMKRPKTRSERADWLHRFAARAMWKMEIGIDVEGEFPESGAVISNHLSYLDIVVFATLRPCVFVSKAEIASWPVVGWMTTMSGTVYVARGHGGSALKARDGMQSAVAAGLPVVFFPEGTTSNGHTLLKFHSGLLGQVMMNGTPVTAAHVSYRLGSGNAADVTVENDVCYWGDVKLPGHIFRFLGLRGVRAEVRFADAPIKFSGDATHRKRAATEARVAVSALRD